MGVYLNTFRSEHKTAILGGLPVKVYASRYLCRANDVDGWDRSSPRSRLLQANMERSAALFAEHKPVYVASVYEKDWEDAHVYAEPKGALWYDTDAFPGRLIGFLTKPAGRRGYAIVTERRGERQHSIAGNTLTRGYLQRVVDGEIIETPLYWRGSTGLRYTPEQIETWRATAEPAWLAECKRQQDEQHERESVAMREREAKLAAKDEQIAQAERQLEALRQERSAI